MIHELTYRKVAHIPDLDERVEWQPGEPWRLNRDRSYWWRIATCGTIYQVRIDTGEARRF